MRIGCRWLCQCPNASPAPSAVLAEPAAPTKLTLAKDWFRRPFSSAGHAVKTVFSLLRGPMVGESYHVRIAKDQLVFSAGHFITYDCGTCERLHGHNYRVAAEVSGPLDENHYVVDFIALRDALQAIVDQWDHHMLLPTRHAAIGVRAGDKEVEVTFEDRRWVFPRGDCVLLPLANTTSEMLARTIGHGLLDDLQRRTGTRPTRVRVEVDECFGQIATADLQNE